MESQQIRRELASVERRLSGLVKGKLEFIRILCATLLEMEIEESKGYYDMIELTETRIEGDFLASVWYFILLSIGCTEEQLSSVKSCISYYYQNMEFDLMLAMTEMIVKMDQENFQLYKSHPEFPDVSSKVEFLRSLRMNGHLKEEKVSLFRSQLRETDCPELHTPLTNFCKKYGISVLKIVVPSKKYKRCCEILNSTWVIVSVSIFIILAILLAGVLVYYLYKNNHTPSSEKVTVFMGSVASLFYNKFFVNEVILSCENCDANNPVNVSVVPEAELPQKYDDVVIPRKQLEPYTTAPDNQRFEIPYDKTTLMCNPSGESNFEFVIQWTGNTQDVCPAQLYFFDSQNSIDTFVRNDDRQYPGNIRYATNTTGCLEPGNRTISFKLIPNTMYHIGFYVSKSVNYSIWLSASLKRYNISRLEEDCRIVSKSATCPITHTRYPTKQGNVYLLFSTASTSPKTINATSVLVQWNWPQLIGVIVFCIGAVLGVAVFVFVGFRCQKRSSRTTINTPMREYGSLQ